MNDETILAIDCGTQSLRALLFSQDGELLAIAREIYTPYVSPRPGWVEQDPEVYRKIYKAMAPLYAVIKKITGYPE